MYCNISPLTCGEGFAKLPSGQLPGRAAGMGSAPVHTSTLRAPSTLTMRQPGCVDYSEQILQFCHEQSPDARLRAPVHSSCEASWRSSALFAIRCAQSLHSDSTVRFFSFVPITELGHSGVVLVINLQESEGRPWG